MDNEKQIIRAEYSDIMQKSYIDYAMSVIISRALPDVRDGLKPVQRRTLYDMWRRTRHPLRPAIPEMPGANRRRHTMGKYHPATAILPSTRHSL
ncbi:MAG: DNA gyrase subunit A [Lachnospiraceae bacterium]